MLTNIHIRHLVTIEEMELTLPAGLIILTGETGAGKSIFLEAIELALGGRGSLDLIRAGKEQADVSLYFDISQHQKAVAWLKAHDFYLEEAECIIRRTINTDGRSRAYINGFPSTLQLLREVGSLLFHLHGQHEQQTLFQNDYQRNILDEYADHAHLTEEVRTIALALQEVQKEITFYRSKMLERQERSTLLRFQLDEFESLKPHLLAWSTLEAEHHRLNHAEQLTQDIHSILGSLRENEEHNIVNELNQVRKKFEAIQTIDKGAGDWLQSIHTILIQLSELTDELRHYLTSNSFDPEKLVNLEQLVSQIFSLSRKYKTSPEQLAALGESLALEYQTLESSDIKLSELEEKQQLLKIQYQTSADKLSESRLKAANQLAQLVEKTLRSLALPYAEFYIHLEKNPFLPENVAFSPYGQEKIQFLIKTNPEQSLQPLAKVISGGELSRLSLSIHLALTHQKTLPTLIFDEIDTGIGGSTADKMGKLLRQLGEDHQVFCITHQPQVASCGHHHLLVEKKVREQTTYTELHFLEREAKRKEIARMLGGEKITAKTLANADELLAQI